MKRFETLGDNIYNSLFNSEEGFDLLKDEKPFYQAICIVLFISVIDALVKLNLAEHTSVLNLGFSLVSKAMGGIISWVFFAFFVEMVASIFGRQGQMRTFLILSAFALLPWIFLGPLELFKQSELAPVVAIAVILGLLVWFRTVVLFLRAIAKTYDTTVRKTIYFILIPFLGSIIYFNWFYGFFATLGKILF